MDQRSVAQAMSADYAQAWQPCHFSTGLPSLSGKTLRVPTWNAILSNELQFALIFVTLMVLAGILFSRLGRFERYLKNLEGIRGLEDRLHGLTETLDHLEGNNGSARVEQQLSEVQALLVQIRDGLDSQTGAVDRGTLVPSQISADMGMAELAERKLYNLGFQEVNIISDLTDTMANDAVRIVIEAKKDGAIYKGHLIIHGSSMIEMDLQPAFSSFP